MHANGLKDMPSKTERRNAALEEHEEYDRKKQKNVKQNRTEQQNSLVQ